MAETKKAKPSNLILGIDPGSRVTGYALLFQDGSFFKAIRCDVLRLNTEEDHTERMAKLYAFFTDLIKQYSPVACAIETPVYGKDPLAMLKLGRAQAACMLAATNSGVPVTEYYPKEVKKSITGNGNSSKKQVAYMIERAVSLPETQLKLDATDALAVAWCHSLRKKLGFETVPKKKLHQNAAKTSWSAFAKQNEHRIKTK